jgi:hypothetical protein
MPWAVTNDSFAPFDIDFDVTHDAVPSRPPTRPCGGVDELARLSLALRPGPVDEPARLALLTRGAETPPGDAADRWM